MSIPPDVLLLASDCSGSLKSGNDTPLAELAREIERRLDRSPHFVVVRGLACSADLLLALVHELGEVALPTGNVGFDSVQTIRPGTDLAVADIGVLTERMHTDATGWPFPHELTAIWCVVPDENGGGMSRFLDLEDLLTEFHRANSDCIQILASEIVPWRQPDYLGGRTLRALVLENDTVRYMKHTIQEGLRLTGERIPREVARALERFDAAIENCPGEHRFSLCHNDLLIWDNRRTLHARTAVVAPAASQRLFLRTRINRRARLPS